MEQNTKKDTKKRRFGIGKKMYLFVLVTVFVAVAAVAALAYIINVRQIDSYFKRLTLNTAENVASFVDVEFLKELKAVVAADEYQALRDRAEEEDDESLIEEYLREKGLWERYVTQREYLIQYVGFMDDVKYLYLIVWADKGEEPFDMYLVDADDVPLYETGYYEEREEEFGDADPHYLVDPVISNGDWGWLCSGYAPVYDAEGNLICNVGCDIGMAEMIRERRVNLIYLIISAAAILILIFIGAIIFAKKLVVKPLDSITKGMKKFSPNVDKDYKEAGVIDLDIKSNDEIGDIYHEIQSMQTRIIDYIGNIDEIERDKKKAEDNIRARDQVIGNMSKEAYKDALTGIGNKSAYERKLKELNQSIDRGRKDFAIVMTDANNLKMINDKFGHGAGDDYLKGCCHIVCEVFKHSPVFRIGGDEFVAVLTGEDFRMRNDKLKKLCETFEETYANTEAEPWERYSASIGMSEFRVGDSKAEEVFKRADESMYEYKLAFKKRNGIPQDARA